MDLTARCQRRLFAFLGSLLCVIAVLAGAVPAASAAVPSPTATAAGKLVPSYVMSFDNITYSTVSDGSLTKISVNKSGHVSGNMTVDPPLGGPGPLAGKLKGDTFTFSVGTGDYKGTIDTATGQISGTYTYPGQDGEWHATPASQCQADGTCKPVKCPKAYEKPAEWVTQPAKAPNPEIKGYVEPINVVISACSTVSLSEIEAALGNWSTVASSWVDLDGLHFKCISPEKANEAPDGSHRYHLDFFHCIDGGPGSYHAKHPNGYADGATEFTNNVVTAAKHWGWDVHVKTVKPPVAGKKGVGEDGVTFNGTVYVITVTLPAN